MRYKNYTIKIIHHTLNNYMALNLNKRKCYITKVATFSTSGQCYTIQINVIIMFLLIDVIS